MLKLDLDTMVIFNIDDPKDHSCVGYVHNAVYKLANINAINLTKIVKKDHLDEFIKAVKTVSAVGLYLTKPHKTKIIPFLDECDEVAKKFGCVNCVKFENGKSINLDHCSSRKIKFRNTERPQDDGPSADSKDEIPFRQRPFIKHGWRD